MAFYARPLLMTSAVVLAILFSTLVSTVSAHYELTRPIPRGVSIDQQRIGPCGGFEQVQARRIYSDTLQGSVEVQLYWDGNVEVFLGFGSNPTSFPYKLGEQPNAQMNTKYTIQLDFSGVPASDLQPGRNATLQTVCHFSPTIDLYQCADMIIGTRPANLPEEPPLPTTTRSTVATLAPGATVLNENVREAASILTDALDLPGGCMKNEIHMKNTDPSQNLAALWLRAVFHDFATFDPSAANPGGADGSLVHMLDKKEHIGINNSIATAFIFNKNKSLSDPDLIALGGAVSVAHCGGPQMFFEAGRIANAVPVDPKGRVPEDTEPYTKVKARLKAMGMTDEEMVALVVGGHSLGGAHKAISPHLTNETFQPFDTTPGVFDNDVFKQVLSGRCVTNIDCSMAADASLRPHIERFAASQSAFFNAFDAAYIRMTRLPQKELKGLGGDGHEHLVYRVHKDLVKEVLGVGLFLLERQLSPLRLLQ
ncbi:heme peroxidase [Chytridium lagenaria]|nr:heme peroxidase [Chytridium lagenaria]